MSSHKLPNAFFECIGRIEFLQTNWYLEEPVHAVLNRITGLLSSFVIGSMNVDRKRDKTCFDIARLLEGMDVIFQTVPMTQSEFATWAQSLNDDLDHIIDETLQKRVDVMNETDAYAKGVINSLNQAIDTGFVPSPNSEVDEFIDSIRKLSKD